MTPISTQGYIYSATSGTSWGDRLSSINGTSITYDEIGNPLLYKGTTMTWSGRELLSMYNANERLTATFEYNDEGLRTRKVANGSNHVYIYDGSKIINEQIGSSSVIYLYDESGSPIGLRYRTSTMAESEFVSVFFEKNLFGDIIALYNINGVLIGSYTYDAWGNHTYTESGNSSLTSAEVRVGRYYNPFRYRGYYYDSETGLYYLHSRYYDPATGRFLNADGYVSTGTGLLGYNMYAYCNNNPVMYVDPTGEWGLIALGVVLLGALLLSSCSAPSTTTNDKAYPPKEDAGVYKSVEVNEEYKNYTDALDDAYEMVHENGVASGYEYGAVIYIHKYDEGRYMIPNVYTNGSSNTVYYRDWHEGSEWLAIASVHYHPTFGDSTALSQGDYNVARDNQIAMYAINASGAKAESFMYLRKATNKLPWYLNSWNDIIK